MALSRRRRGVLALGRQITHELEIDNRVDTLGRWIAYHLSDLMNEAENAGKPKDRRRAQREAAELVFKLWDHRADELRRQTPMRRYGQLTEFLEQLRNPHGRFLRGRPRLASGTFAEAALHLYGSARSLATSVAASIVPEDDAYSGAALNKLLTLSERRFLEGARALSAEEQRVSVRLDEAFQPGAELSEEDERSLENIRRQVSDLEERLNRLKDLLEGLPGGEENDDGGKTNALGFESI